ncbi:MAG TPA: hypothetical protein VK602_04960, partial [Phyllobacterium sp.]|nr:hypothetical protein [Phyllobacterium sp.]
IDKICLMMKYIAGAEDAAAAETPLPRSGFEYVPLQSRVNSPKVQDRGSTPSDKAQLPAQWPGFHIID